MLGNHFVEIFFLFRRKVEVRGNAFPWMLHQHVEGLVGWEIWVKELLLVQIYTQLIFSTSQWL